MASILMRNVYGAISRSEWVGINTARKCSIKRYKLKRRLKKEETDNLLPLLLRVMDLLLCLSKDYQKNIENFDGRYLLQTKKGGFRSGVIFSDGYMKIPEEDMLYPDVEITFEDPKSLLQFILSKRQDMLDLVLNNGIEIDGNFNLALKFWFMVRELKERLGLET
jgi:hypothetical protein